MNKDFLNNKTLISCLRNGNNDAYVYLVNTYHHGLCVYANSLLRDKDSAQDIVQNVFFKVWKKRKQLKVEYSIKNYLYKATYNEFIDYYRKSQSVFLLEKKYLETLDIVVMQNDENSLDQLIEIVKKEIQLLPPKCKQVFTLSKYEGLTYTEIAEHLNISIKSVEALMTRSFSTLRKKLGTKLETFLFFFYNKQSQLNKDNWIKNITFCCKNNKRLFP